ncbi:protein of unknown function [Denitratisoma oestradiolicum]|uniref:Uncharacterized protein n=1 Tax=Denitratisoma oestradiolicum TaxID=311182 RepID=A0A6S6XT57_9PROT|nr:protein of unknown function [Denitratisoma oestradiolicum]
MPMRKGQLNAPHPRSTAGFGGAKQCFAQPRLRPLPRAGLPISSLRSTVTPGSVDAFSRLKASSCPATNVF